MPEVQETIVQKNPPKPGKVMWELVSATGEKYKAFSAEATIFEVGQRYHFNFEPKEFNGFAYKNIKGPVTLVTGTPRASAAPPKAADIGPHIGMWEKIVSELLAGGMSEEAIPAHIILCRRLARDGLKADIDGKLPEPNDNLDDTF